MQEGHIIEDYIAINYCNSDKDDHIHFLTHIETGMSTEELKKVISLTAPTIYTSAINAHILKVHFKCERAIMAVEFGKTYQVYTKNRKMFIFTCVRSYYNCGSMVLIARGDFGTFIYTGFSAVTFESFNLAIVKDIIEQHTLTKLYLDCTYYKSSLEFFSVADIKKSLLQFFKSRNDRFYIHVPIFGLEDLLGHVACGLKEVMVVDEKRMALIQFLGLSQFFTLDKNKGRLHVISQGIMKRNKDSDVSQLVFIKVVNEFSKTANSYMNDGKIHFFTIYPHCTNKDCSDILAMTCPEVFIPISNGVDSNESQTVTAKGNEQLERVKDTTSVESVRHLAKGASEQSKQCKKARTDSRKISKTTRSSVETNIVGEEPKRHVKVSGYVITEGGIKVKLNRDKHLEQVEKSTRRESKDENLKKNHEKLPSEDVGDDQSKDEDWLISLKNKYTIRKLEKQKTLEENKKKSSKIAKYRKLLTEAHFRTHLKKFAHNISSNLNEPVNSNKLIIENDGLLSSLVTKATHNDSVTESNNKDSTSSEKEVVDSAENKDSQIHDLEACSVSKSRHSLKSGKHKDHISAEQYPVFIEHTYARLPIESNSKETTNPPQQHEFDENTTVSMEECSSSGEDNLSQRIEIPSYSGVGGAPDNNGLNEGDINQNSSGICEEIVLEDENEMGSVETVRIAEEEQIYSSYNTDKKVQESIKENQSQHRKPISDEDSQHQLGKLNKINKENQLQSANVKDNLSSLKQLTKELVDKYHDTHNLLSQNKTGVGKMPLGGKIKLKNIVELSDNLNADICEPKELPPLVPFSADDLKNNTMPSGTSLHSELGVSKSTCKIVNCSPTSVGKPSENIGSYKIQQRGKKIIILKDPPKIVYVTKSSLNDLKTPGEVQKKVVSVPDSKQLSTFLHLLRNSPSFSNCNIRFENSTTTSSTGSSVEQSVSVNTNELGNKPSDISGETKTVPVKPVSNKNSKSLCKVLVMDEKRVTLPSHFFIKRDSKLAKNILESVEERLASSSNSNQLTTNLTEKERSDGHSDKTGLYIGENNTSNQNVVPNSPEKCALTGSLEDSRNSSEATPQPKESSSPSPRRDQLNIKVKITNAQSSNDPGKTKPTPSIKVKNLAELLINPSYLDQNVLGPSVKEQDEGGLIPPSENTIIVEDVSTALTDKDTREKKRLDGHSDKTILHLEENNTLNQNVDPETVAQAVEPSAEITAANEELDDTPLPDQTVSVRKKRKRRRSVWMKNIKPKKKSYRWKLIGSNKTSDSKTSEPSSTPPTNKNNKLNPREKPDSFNDSSPDSTHKVDSPINKMHFSDIYNTILDSNFKGDIIINLPKQTSQKHISDEVALHESRCKVHSSCKDFLATLHRTEAESKLLAQYNIQESFVPLIPDFKDTRYKFSEKKKCYVQGRNRKKQSGLNNKVTVKYLDPVVQEYRMITEIVDNPAIGENFDLSSLSSRKRKQKSKAKGQKKMVYMDEFCADSRNITESQLSPPNLRPFYDDISNIFPDDPPYFNKVKSNKIRTVKKYSSKRPPQLLPFEDDGSDLDLSNDNLEEMPCDTSLPGTNSTLLKVGVDKSVTSKKIEIKCLNYKRKTKKEMTNVTHCGGSAQQALSPCLSLSKVTKAQSNTPTVKGQQPSLEFPIGKICELPLVEKSQDTSPLEISLPQHGNSLIRDSNGSLPAEVRNQKSSVTQESTNSYPEEVLCKDSSPTFQEPCNDFEASINESSNPQKSRNSQNKVLGEIKSSASQELSTDFDQVCNKESSIPQELQTYQDKIVGKGSSIFQEQCNNDLEHDYIDDSSEHVHDNEVSISQDLCNIEGPDGDAMQNDKSSTDNHNRLKQSTSIINKSKFSEPHQNESSNGFQEHSHNLLMKSFTCPTDSKLMSSINFKDTPSIVGGEKSLASTQNEELTTAVDTHSVLHNRELLTTVSQAEESSYVTSEGPSSSQGDSFLSADTSFKLSEKSSPIGSPSLAASSQRRNFNDPTAQLLESYKLNQRLSYQFMEMLESQKRLQKDVSETAANQKCTRRDNTHTSDYLSSNKIKMKSSSSRLLYNHRFSNTKSVSNQRNVMKKSTVKGKTFVHSKLKSREKESRTDNPSALLQEELSNLAKEMFELPSPVEMDFDFT